MYLDACTFHDRYNIHNILLLVTALPGNVQSIRLGAARLLEMKFIKYSLIEVGSRAAVSAERLLRLFVNRKL